MGFAFRWHLFHVQCLAALLDSVRSAGFVDGFESMTGSD